MKKNISKLLLVVFIMLFIIPFNVKALLTKETTPAVNTFTIEQPQICMVTRNYYYIDETDNRTQAKISTTNNVDKTYARVDQTGTPGYLTYKAN